MELHEMAIFLIGFVIIISILQGWNPAKLFQYTDNTTVSADCVNYKNQVDQQQTEINRLNQDLSNCKTENTCGFSWITFFSGVMITGIGAYFLFQWIDKNHRSRYEKLNDSWEKEIEKLKKKRKK
jgi:predicted negative regulator of RcsB-dependent stress response